MIKNNSHTITIKNSSIDNDKDDDQDINQDIKSFIKLLDKNFNLADIHKSFSVNKKYEIMKADFQQFPMLYE